MKPVLLVVEPKAHRRLKLVAGLRDDFQVEPLLTLDAALRQVRSMRPGVVLIGIGRRPEPGLRLCRQIKTDAGIKARVGLIDWASRLTNPSEALDASSADGIFRGEPKDGEAVAFATALDPSAPPVHGTPKPRGLRRLFS